CFFFFQAEDGIRDFHVTGVQTCALPISVGLIWLAFGHAAIKSHVVGDAALRIVSSFYAALLLLVRSRCSGDNGGYLLFGLGCLRSEERRVGKEGSGRRVGDGVRKGEG